MKVWMNRDTCNSNLSACESCFGQFLRTGIADRGCVMRWEDDDSDDITVYMHTDGQDRRIVIPSELRETVSYEGWSKFVDWQPRYERNVTARPEPIRG
ncbi:MAG: hypothetical protein KDH92_09795 [Chloroflexi bacterium]|nr:hypothetical protein [Chloroflexota bacterium]